MFEEILKISYIISTSFFLFIFYFFKLLASTFGIRGRASDLFKTDTVQNIETKIRIHPMWNCWNKRKWVSKALKLTLSHILNKREAIRSFQATRSTFNRRCAKFKVKNYTQTSKEKLKTMAHCTTDVNGV